MTSVDAAALAEILDLVAERRGLGFADWRRDAVARGVASRTAARGAASTAAYRALLDDEEDEVEQLVATLLVPVTSFFRDRPVFDALAGVVLPDLAARLAPGDVLRAWVVGVATGEEAWTTAILLGQLAAAQPGLRWEVLASDVSDASLDVARAGLYPVEALDDVPPERRGAAFELVDGRARVVDALRAGVRFVRHDLVGARLAPTASVVASFHLLLLRNVLIWFEPRLQRIALERVRAVVEPGGALVLGPVESIPAALEPALRPYPGVPPELAVRRREGP